MRDLVAFFYFVIVASGLPSYPIHPGVGAIYKGADSQTVIEGPDGSIIKAQARGGSVATRLKNHAVVIVTEPAPVVEINKEVIATGILGESTNIEGPSGVISTSGSRAVIAGPASTTISGPAVATAPITQVRKSAVSISKTETIYATSVAPPIIVEDIAAVSPNLVGQGLQVAGAQSQTTEVEANIRAGQIRAQQEAAAQIEEQRQAAAQIEAQQQAAAQIEAQQRAAAQIEAQQRAAARIEAQQRAAAEQQAAAQIEVQQPAAAQIEAQRVAAVRERAVAEIRAQEQAEAELRTQQRVAATIQAREQAAAGIRAEEQAAAQIRAQEEAAAEAQAQQQVAAEIREQEQAAAETRAQQRLDAEIRAQEQVAASIRAQQEAAEIRGQQHAGASNLRNSRLNIPGVSKAANRPGGKLFLPVAPPTSLAASGLSSARLAAEAGLAASPALLNRDTQVINSVVPSGNLVAADSNLVVPAPNLVAPAANLVTPTLETVPGIVAPQLIAADIATPQLVTAEIATPQLITAEIPAAHLFGIATPQLIAIPGLSTATAEVTNGLVGAKSVVTAPTLING